MKPIDINKGKGYFSNHPVLANILVIIIIGIIGVWIVYLSLQLFTRHGAGETVPGVENMSYTDAIKTLHGKGFRVDIRDSLFKDDINPGYVIEQYPRAGATVKPGRKIFLYINAVHPREMVIDPDNNPGEYALKGYSFRQGMARLEELGFKKVSVVKVEGDHDRIIKIKANGHPVNKMEKVPVNAEIIVEVCDGRLSEQSDSLLNEEYLNSLLEGYEIEEELPAYDDNYEDEYVEDEEPLFVQ